MKNEKREKTTTTKRRRKERKRKEEKKSKWVSEWEGCVKEVLYRYALFLRSHIFTTDYAIITINLLKPLLVVLRSCCCRCCCFCWCVKLEWFAQYICTLWLCVCCLLSPCANYKCQFCHRTNITNTNWMK